MQKTHVKSMVITGASSGLGLALARHYLERGATVAAFARRGDLLQALAAEFPDRVFYYSLDVRDAAAVQNAANDFIARAGVPDVVIANAGVSVGTLTEYAEDIDAFQQVMDINVLGMVKISSPSLRRCAPRNKVLWSASPAWRVFAGCPGRAPTQLPRLPPFHIWNPCGWNCMAAG